MSRCNGVKQVYPEKFGNGYILTTPCDTGLLNQRFLILCVDLQAFGEPTEECSMLLSQDSDQWLYL